MLPECAKWKVWYGSEIEGHSEVGKKTLFIRDIGIDHAALKEGGESLLSKFTRSGAVNRVWFCKEFTDWNSLRLIAKAFNTVCIETTPKLYHTLPRDLAESCVIYVKVNLSLKDGDHICVGPAFQDESFMIGTGAKVKPEQYAKDVKVK